jgi:hypothetical protein
VKGRRNFSGGKNPQKVDCSFFEKVAVGAVSYPILDSDVKENPEKRLPSHVGRVRRMINVKLKKK